jgi:hypothetical protein
MFSAWVGRLALSPTNGLEGPGSAPCAAEAAADQLTDTSVRVTRRVIIGASVDYVARLSDPGAGIFRWMYDVQVTGGRRIGACGVVACGVCCSEGRRRGPDADLGFTSGVGIRLPSGGISN